MQTHTDVQSNTRDTIIDLAENGAHIVLLHGKEAFRTGWPNTPASIADITAHRDSFGWIPGSRKLVCIDFDAGDPQWLTELLKANDVPYALCKTRRGWHVYVKVRSTDGIDRNWRNEHGKGEVRCIGQNCKLWDADAVIELLDAPGATCGEEFFALLAPKKERNKNHVADTDLASAIVSAMQELNPQARLSDDYLHKCYCPNPDHDDKNPGAAVARTTGVIVCTTCDNPSPAQAAIWLDIELSPAPAPISDLPDTWRTAMLEHLSESEAAICEGIVRIYQKHGEIPTKRIELLFNLGDVGFQLPSRTVDRFISESGLLHSDFDKFLARLAYQIARRAGRRRYERESFKGRLLACKSILRDLGAKGGMDTKSAAKKRRKVRKVLMAGGESSPLDLSYFDGAIKSGADYRAAVMRAVYTSKGGHSRTNWGKMLGCHWKHVTSVAKRCKLKLIAQEAIEVAVKTVSDCFNAQAQHPKSRIAFVSRGGAVVTFTKAMKIQQGDTVVIQPISEHLELDDVPAETAEKETSPNDSLHSTTSTASFGEVNNMARPDGKWRGRDWDPKWIYWQHLFALEAKGWEIDEANHVIRYGDDFKLDNPELLALKIIIERREPIVMELPTDVIVLANGMIIPF